MCYRFHTVSHGYLVLCTKTGYIFLQRPNIFIGVFVTGGSAAFQLPAQFQFPRAGVGIGQLVQQQAGGLVPCRAVMQVGTGQRPARLSPTEATITSSGTRRPWLRQYWMAPMAMISVAQNSALISPTRFAEAPSQRGSFPQHKKPHPCGCGLRIYFIPLWRLHGGGGRCPPVPSG